MLVVLSFNSSATSRLYAMEGIPCGEFTFEECTEKDQQRMSHSIRKANQGETWPMPVGCLMKLTRLTLMLHQKLPNFSRIKHELFPCYRAIEESFQRIFQWSCNHRLLINPEKNKMLIVGSRLLDHNNAD